MSRALLRFRCTICPPEHSSPVQGVSSRSLLQGSVDGTRSEQFQSEKILRLPTAVASTRSQTAICESERQVAGTLSPSKFEPSAVRQGG